MLAWLVLGWMPALVGATAVQADADGSAESTAYGTAIDEALQHFDAGAWQAAYDAFVRAHRLQPGARTLRGMGMAAFNMDRHARARRHFEAALVATRQPLTAAQREHVHQLLEQSRTRTGRYALRPSPAGARVWIDDQIVGDRLLLLDVGIHELYLDAEGHQPLHRSFEVRGGEDEVLELVLRPDAPQPAAATTPARSARAPAPVAARSEAETDLPWTGIVLSASAAMWVGALVAGLSEQKAEADLDALCPGRVCQPTDRRRAGALSSEIETLQLVTDVFLVTGLVGTGCAAWLWLSAGDASESRAALRPQLGCDATGCRLGVAGRL